MSPALAGGFLTTAIPGKPLYSKLSCLSSSSWKPFYKQNCLPGVDLGSFIINKAPAGSRSRDLQQYSSTALCPGPKPLHLSKELLTRRAGGEWGWGGLKFISRSKGLYTNIDIILKGTKSSHFCQLHYP